MQFLQKKIHYLGHLISVDGIKPLTKKLDSICNMPRPRSPKEIKQFLGLTGYYRKFIRWFSDMARPLTKLLAHDCKFVWNNQCDILFQMLKDTLCSVPILKYPDTRKPYMLYTDDSKYRWPGVLTQRHTSTVDGKEITMDHPVLYVSGLFQGSQLNWAALTKEAYAIYMSIKIYILSYRTWNHTEKWSFATQEIPEDDDTQQYGKQLVNCNWKFQYKFCTYFRKGQHLSRHLKQVNRYQPWPEVYIALKVLNKFGGRVTQRRMQEVYEVKAKQVAGCITGFKYLSRAERGPGNGKHWMRVTNLQTSHCVIFAGLGQWNTHRLSQDL